MKKNIKLHGYYVMKKGEKKKKKKKYSSYGITIPKFMIDTLGWKVGYMLEIRKTDNDELILRRITNSK